MSRIARRWGDNDRYFGPFTYAKDDSYQRWEIMLESGDDEYRGAQLRLAGFSRTLIIAIPQIIRPWRRKVKAGPSWDAATIARLGRDWYYDTHQRAFGISLTGSVRQDGGYDFLQIKFGAQTNDSRTDMNKGWFLPWKSWRHVRHSLYDLNGEHFGDMPKGNYLATLSKREALQTACPAMTFAFADYDGEQLTAQTKIEEREWRLGEGWFKWLSVFREPNISRSLDIRFSGETGKRKGSWKGGTIGHSIDMLSGELHESAFRRYCAKHAMTFLGATNTPRPDEEAEQSGADTATAEQTPSA